jgi:hypothetical protein
MAEILLVKSDTVLRGVTPEDDAAWKKFKGTITEMGAGELVRLTYTMPRNVAFHRKFFAMLTVGFEHWEPSRKHKTYKGRPIEKNFEQFRSDVTILAGCYDQTFDLRGRMHLKAHSISFGKMDQDTFEKLYNAVASVLLKDVLANYTRADLDRVVNELLHF